MELLARCAAKRRHRTSMAISIAVFFVFVCYFAVFSRWTSRPDPLDIDAVATAHILGQHDSSSSSAAAEAGEKKPEITPAAVVPCKGPDGLLLSDDQSRFFIKASKLDALYAVPQGGSHRELGLEDVWMTARDRYGPYGYGERDNQSDDDDDDDNQDSDFATTSSPRVDWAAVDWALLQDECLARNAFRFRNASTIAAATRRGFEFRQARDRPRPDLHRGPDLTGRTALVLRMWDSYDYSPEDLWHIRSLVMETALASGGEYAVFLLVDAKDHDIFASTEAYNQALQEFVPREFRSISILFNTKMRQDWYQKVHETNLLFQMMQPLQLFAYFVDAFDHYWDLEADVRYTGNARAYLDAVAAFARNEPRKQSRERASFFYMPDVHGSYKQFMASVDTSMPADFKGVWGPVRIDEVEPIGPSPPVSGPELDQFDWGVGEDADVIVTTPCNDILQLEQWAFQNWLRGFHSDSTTVSVLNGKNVTTYPPRIICSPAVSRGSWNLLNAVHWAQADQGLALPSEATLPSFALWNGLKISLPPQPWYYLTPRDPSKVDEWFNGDSAHIASDGLAHGEAMYKASMPEVARTSTWWFTSPLPRKLFDQWLYGVNDGEELSYILREHEHEIWAPALALHPVKTGANS